jgi:hypothetical protein
MSDNINTIIKGLSPSPKNTSSGTINTASVDSTKKANDKKNAVSSFTPNFSSLNNPPSPKPLTMPTATDQVDKHLTDYQQAAQKGLSKVSTGDIASQVSEVINNLNKQIGSPPKPPDQVTNYNNLTEKYNVNGLNSQIKDLTDKRNNIQTQLDDFNNKTENTPGLMTGAEVTGRESEAQRNAQIKLNSINLQIETASMQLQNANTAISTIMGFQQTDYNNAKEYYNTQFNQAMTIENTIFTQKTEAQKVATSQLQVVQNSIISGTSSYDTLTPEAKASISQLENQAGLPQGFTESMHSTLANNPAGFDKIISTNTTTGQTVWIDKSGNFHTADVQPTSTIGAIGSWLSGLAAPIPPTTQSTNNVEKDQLYSGLVQK